MRGGREHAWKRAALLLAAGAAAAGGCAWAVQGKLTTAWYEVPLPAGLEGLDGVKIAQISDVHSADLERPLGAALAAAAIVSRIFATASAICCFCASGIIALPPDCKRHGHRR